MSRRGGFTSDSVRRAIAAEELAGLRIATIARLLGLGVIAVWVTIENEFPAVFFVYPFLFGFAAIGVAQLSLRRSGRERRWHRLVFPALDFTLLVIVALSPNPFDDLQVPAAMRLRFGNEIYLFLLLTTSLFSSSPFIVLWSGVAAALAWSGGIAWVLGQPGSFLEVPAELWESMSNEERIRAALDPNLVALGTWIRLVVVLILVSASLATAVARLRRLVLRQAEAERQRTNLSRYFSPTVVDELAESDDPLGDARLHDVAVLFADIVGFTAMSEQSEPEEVMRLLREFHSRMEKAVFDHGGTLDKYIGDGVMATFGTPEPGPHDATSALRCARAMLAAVDAWNDKREASGERRVRIGIGLHVGEAIVGSVGSEQRLEFTVVGDTVNVASRLERLTRKHGLRLVVSDVLVDRARREGVIEIGTLENLELLPSQRVPGREGEIAIYGLR